MAITVTFYPLTLKKVCESLGASVDYLTGTMRLSLHSSTYSPVHDSDDFFNDATGELTAGSGYNAGGETLAGKTITYDNTSDQIRWDANDVTWTFTASKTWRNAVMYVDTAGASSTDPLYAKLVWDSDQTVSTSYTLQWDPAGILFIDTT